MYSTDCTTHLKLKRINTQVIGNDSAFVSLANNASFSWLNCDDNHSELGVYTNYLLMKPNLNVAFEVSQKGCVDTSWCMTPTTVGIYLDNSLLKSSM